LADGKKMIERQDYARAVLQFKNAVQLMPSDPEARYQLGLATLGLHDLRGAMVLFQEAHQLAPKHIGAQLKLAELMSSTGDPELLEESEKRVESVLSSAPGSSDALDLLAVDELKLGRAASAEEYLRQSLQSNPGQEQVYQKLAALAVARNDLDGAEKSLKLGIDASPRSAGPRLFLGEFYVFARRMSDAEAQFQMAVKLNSQSGAALLDLGRVQMENGDSVAAERTFERASSLPDKRYRSVHAIFLWSQGKTEAAIREFANLARGDRKDRRARSRLVAAYLATKNRPEALRILRDALKNSPHDLDALVQRSEIYLDENRVAEAEGDLHQAVRLAPRMATVHYLLSRVFKARRQEALRRQALYQAIQLDPSLLAARIELADTFIAQPRVALELMNAIPREQAHSLPALVMRNWGLLAAGDLAEAQKGISEGLAQSSTPELTLQTAVLKLKLLDVKGSRLALEEVLRKEPGNLRALRALANSFFFREGRNHRDRQSKGARGATTRFRCCPRVSGRGLADRWRSEGSTRRLPQK